jgi:hypothetical protein
MAKQKGTVKYDGTINGVNYYMRKGEALARSAGGGFSSEGNKKSPRIKENSSEFGMVSQAKKLFRLGLHPFLADLSDVTLHGRMMTLFQKIKVLDTVSERGQRLFQNGLATDEGRFLLMQFDITTQKASMMIPGTGEFDQVSQNYTLANIKPDAMRLPKGATGMQLCLGILQADFEARTWKFFSSPALSIDADFNATTHTLTPTALPTGNGVGIAVLQVRFYQEVNGKQFLLNDLGAQGLEFVGVY